jgi:hypothetical protein
LFDEDGTRIRGKENKETARLALARVKLAETGERAPGVRGLGGGPGLLRVPKLFRCAGPDARETPQAYW